MKSTHFQDLEPGDCFRFPFRADGNRIVYEYRGNGWYGRPYSGGPWHSNENPGVHVLRGAELKKARQKLADLRRSAPHE